MTCVDEVAGAVSVDGVGSIALSEVGVAKGKGTDGDGGDGSVGEKKSHEVEGQVVDGCGVSIGFAAAGWVGSIVIVLVEEAEELSSGVTEGEAGDPGADANDATEGEVLVSLNNCDGLTDGLHGLVSFPEESTLDVSSDGDAERPGEEEDHGEELPEAEEVSGLGVTGIVVVEGLVE